MIIITEVFVRSLETGCHDEEQSGGQGGLFDVKPTPDFAKTGQIVMLYTYSGNGGLAPMARFVRPLATVARVSERRTRLILRIGPTEFRRMASRNCSVPLTTIRNG